MKKPHVQPLTIYHNFCIKHANHFDMILIFNVTPSSLLQATQVDHDIAGYSMLHGSACSHSFGVSCMWCVGLVYALWIQREGHALRVYQRSICPHLHASFAAPDMVDRWQLSASPKFSVTPWHQAPYVSCVSDVRFIWMLHVFHLYVACVSSRCCICCNGYTHMLQVYVLNVLFVSNVRCKCFI
jgi:hypothetical protein